MPFPLDLDPARFRRDFNHRPFGVRHRLVGHPLFTLPRLIELARRLRPEDVEYNAGRVPVSLDPSRTPRNGLSVEETIRRIEDCGSWMVLKWVERDPEYRAVLDECLDQVRALSEPLYPGMHQREAFVFITSPGSVTPFHVDPEHNFLLQIRGTKTMHVFDRGLVPHDEMEARLGGGTHRNLTFQDEYQAAAMSFRLEPGLGVHVPVGAPHWVQNGDGVSISFSITFRSHASERESALCRLNTRLRGTGIAPMPIGASAVRDAVKFGAVQLLRPAKHLADGLLRRRSAARP